MRMNHWSEMSGSIRSPERCENGTTCWYGSLLDEPALCLAARRRPPRCASRDGEAREALAGRGGHAAVLADHADLGQAVAAADLEVVRVVAGRDLQRAGAELGLDVVVGDDRQLAPDERQDRRLPDQVLVALVVRVHRDGGVGEHRLRAHGRDRDHLALAAGERVRDVGERVDDLAVLDLEVGDRRAGARIPVDHVVVAVDVALLVEVDEDLQDGLVVAGVEREALVLVVERGAEALELLDDRASRTARATPTRAARTPRGRSPRGDVPSSASCFSTCFCVAMPAWSVPSDPLRALPARAVEADQDVLDRAVERVAHVQRAGDVRRRHRDRVVLPRDRPRARGGRGRSRASV